MGIMRVPLLTGWWWRFIINIASSNGSLATCQPGSEHFILLSLLNLHTNPWGRSYVQYCTLRAHLSTDQSRFKRSAATCAQGLFYRTDEMEREDESGARKQNSLATTVQERSNDWKGLHPKYSTKIWTWSNVKIKSSKESNRTCRAWMDRSLWWGLGQRWLNQERATFSVLLARPCPEWLWGNWKMFCPTALSFTEVEPMLRKINWFSNGQCSSLPILTSF